MLRRNLLQENAVLAAMEASDGERLRAALEPVSLRVGEVLCEPGRQLRDIYFPVTAIATLLCVSDDDTSAGIAMIGNEGMLGIGLLMGVDIARSRAIVQRAGHAFRISWEQLQAACQASPMLQQLLLRSAHALTMQIAQTAVCNRRHQVRQQLARWLLWMLDHSTSNEIYATHESIAGALGVRREAITEAVGRLQESGLLQVGRGRISVLDSYGLRSHACGCYAIIRSESAPLRAGVQRSAVAADQMQAAGSPGS